MRYILFPFILVTYLVVGMILAIIVGVVYYFGLCDNIGEEVLLISDGIIDWVNKKFRGKQ